MMRFKSAVLVLIMAPIAALSADRDCVWAGRVYSDGILKLNGGVCHICQAGKWIDKKAKCDECKPTSTPDETNPALSAKDCTGKRDPANAQLLTFSDGDRVSQADGKFHMCSAGQWIEKQVASTQLCPEQ